MVPFASLAPPGRTIETAAGIIMEVDGPAPFVESMMLVEENDATLRSGVKTTGIKAL